MEGLERSCCRRLKLTARAPRNPRLKGVRVILSRKTRGHFSRNSLMLHRAPAFAGFSLFSRELIICSRNAPFVRERTRLAGMKFMWMPDWLYEHLPQLYLVTGAMCLWLLGTSFVVVLSAILLVAAAVLTYSRRRSARRAAAIRARRRRPRR